MNQDFRSTADAAHRKCEISHVSQKHCTRAARVVRDTGKVHVYLCTRHDQAHGQVIGKVIAFGDNI